MSNSSFMLCRSVYLTGSTVTPTQVLARPLPAHLMISIPKGCRGKRRTWENVRGVFN
ncbi:MAG: hypothetical protein ACPLXM_14190 [Bacteroidales bacterium]